MGLTPPADRHQERVCRETVQNPLLGTFCGGPDADEAERVLREKFGYSDEQIAKLKG